STGSGPRATSRGGIPLHVSVDCEGDLSADYARGGVNLLPTQMGMRATGDLDLARKGWQVLARQLRAAGINMIHSPCVDIDFVPNNPTIGVRSFADTPETVAEWGLAMAETLAAEGIIPTAKHFPGRGFSKVDTHYGLDVNERTLDELLANEFYPYRKLFEAGIPACLPSHTMYRAIDPDGVPASVSKRLHEFTRNELGFDGVLATDAIGMAGVLKFCDNSLPKAACAALVAGNDLVLVKTTEDFEPLVVEEILRAVERGDLTEAELDAHVRRVVGMKFDAGLFERYPVDAEGALAPVRDPENRATVAEIARRCSTLLCDDDRLLPLKPDRRVLCVEPYFPLLQDRGNDFWWHSNMLQEFMSEHSPNIGSHEVLNGGDETDAEAIVAESADYDVTVVVCQKFRNGPSSSHIAGKLIAAGRRVVVLSTNPYEFSIPDNARTVLVTYGQVPPILKNAAAVLYGKAKPAGTWPLANYRSPFDKLGVKP
ncbi:MAG TPA: glycoside hydrolase family 3 N-terminal domain-containing protein, partial [Planctomycetota bacterium]|nr:glycoside hydrolase family 3 N-terminal domain-containing protein [Planctomycetota bacterium]